MGSDYTLTLTAGRVDAVGSQIFRIHRRQPSRKKPCTTDYPDVVRVAVLNLAEQAWVRERLLGRDPHEHFADIRSSEQGQEGIRKTFKAINDRFKRLQLPRAHPLGSQRQVLAIEFQMI